MTLLVAERFDATQNIDIFFPSSRFELNNDSPSGSAAEYLLEQSAILPYLQTLLFEGRLVGVKIERQTRKFYTSLLDQLPENDGSDDCPLIPTDHEPGGYLKKLSHLNLAPLEPVAGNLLIRQSRYLVLEFYTGTTSVELGTVFIKICQTNGVQVIHCAFPAVARITKNARPFRAKTHKDHQCQVKIINGPKKHIGQEFEMIDLSTRGLAFGSEESLETFSPATQLQVSVDCQSSESIELLAVVRHLARVRKNGKNTFVCGIEFDVETRAVAMQIEQKFTSLQRTFIRSLRQETDGLDVNLQL